METLRKGEKTMGDLVSHTGDGLRRQGRKGAAAVTLVLLLVLMAAWDEARAAREFVQIGGSAREVATLVLQDEAGNVIVGGRFQGTATFDLPTGAVQLTSAGGYDGFIAKYSAAGGVIWAKRFGGPGDDEFSRIAISSNGDLIVTGWFSDTADVDPGSGTTELESSGLRDSFLARLTPDADAVWIYQLSGSGHDYFSTLALDVADNIYVTTAYKGTQSYAGPNGPSVSTDGVENFLVMKLDGTGTTQWWHEFAGPGIDLALGLALDGGGSLYVSGLFHGTIDLDPGPGISTLTSAGSRDIFLMKMDTVGTFQWARQMGGPSFDQGWTCATDPAGNVVVIGDFQGTADFDPGPGTLNLSSAGAEDAFVVKLDPTGVLVWARRYGGSSGDWSTRVAVSPTGSTYVVGHFGGLADFSGGAGGLAVASAGNQDAYLLELSSAGTTTSLFRVAGPTFDEMIGLGVANSGKALIAGRFTSTATFGDPADEVTLTALGDQDAFFGPLAGDSDGDGVPDTDDNCLTTANPDQTDTDLDGTGDACDNDDDGDGVVDSQDNCQYNANPGQSDVDSDGLGDVCDSDPDGDGIGETPGEVDNCPLTPNPYQTDTDGDQAGDECDEDDDNDTVCDIDEEGVDCTAGPDNCPTIANSGQGDLDGDGIGDACDADIDGDGACEATEPIGGVCAAGDDNCPITANPSQDDTDLDGAGDACDSDDDGDAIPDGADNCQFIPNGDQADLDLDGLGDVCDGDLDGDGFDNDQDNCLLDANASQADFDGDGLGDACDPDDDEDDVADGADECAGTVWGDVVDPANGCSLTQLCPCEGPRGTSVPWKNHGKYVSCVAHATNAFLEFGLISGSTKDALVSEAGQSDCGRS